MPNHYRLIDFVREELKLTGNKEGCGAGECGTCSMFVDGKLVKSCLTPVQKIAGLRRSRPSTTWTATQGMTVLQRAFHKSGSSQCGYCIPGMVMAATSTLRRNPNAGLDEIKEGLGGNICRCTGYQKILDAVELARDVLNGSKPESALEEEAGASFIGASTRRLDAPAKVTGAIKYAADLWMANMLHLQVLRSPHPHARIVRIDASAARAMPGVECVITSDDVPGVDNFGVFIEDQPIMARGVVRYVGEAVVAVAAETVDIAKAAVRAIQVEYEVLPGLFDPEQAMAEGAVQLHDFAPGNICKHTKIRKGDVELGLKEADLVVEETYETAADRACLSGARGRPGLPGAGRLRHGAVAQPEHHPPPPRAGQDPGPPDQQGAHDHEHGGRRLRRQGRHDLPGHAGTGGDQDAAPGALCVHARGKLHRQRQAPSVQDPLHHGPEARRPHHGDQDGDGGRRRRLRHVDAGRDEQVGHSRAGALRHSQRLGRRHRRVHQQHAQRRHARLRRVPVRVRHRGAPGPVRASAWAWIRWPCAWST